MDFTEAQVLITGGSDGIGRGLAKRLLSSGSRVLVTGRSQSKLEKAAMELPGLEIFLNDIGDPAGRELLAEHIKRVMRGLNILINNAGIQRRVALADDHAPWAERQNEINVLFSGPVHLNHLLIPLLLTNKRNCKIINVTSGGAFIPQTFAPVYSACKAALHSYTVSLRDALANTHCQVIEIIPPAVQTSLAGTGQNHGMPLDEFCDSIFEKLQTGKQEEIGFGPTENLIPELSGQLVKDLFSKSNSRFHINRYT